MISYSAAALIIDNGQILLVKRASKPFKGYWALPGGRKEDGETFEKCAIREVFEETGICINNLQFFGCLRVKNKLGLQFALYYIATPYARARGWKDQTNEISDKLYWSLTDLPRPIVPFHKTIITDYLEQLPLPHCLSGNVTIHTRASVNHSVFPDDHTCED